MLSFEKRPQKERVEIQMEHNNEEASLSRLEIGIF